MSNTSSNKKRKKRDCYTPEERKLSNGDYYTKNRSRILRDRKIKRREATKRAQEIAKIILTLERANIEVSLSVKEIVKSEQSDVKITENL